MKDINWAQETAAKIKKKMAVVVQRNRGNIPYTTVNGRYNDCSGEAVCWWTNGFWGGMMWQLYKATGEMIYKEIAEATEKKLDRALMNGLGMDHDSGFRWLLTAVANYRLTGNKDSLNRGILAADNLAGRFNPAGNFIRAWNDEGKGSRAGWAIIDCMMNLPLLYWASEEQKDPRYRHIAMRHADMAMKNFIREDGSVKHIIRLNPENGAYIESLGGQGYAVGSSWTRGQAWAIYGFALSYRHVKEDRYLDTARRVADYFISCLKENALVPVDFRQPKDCMLEDSTAAAIAACGMLEIDRQLRADGTSGYYQAALRLLKALDRNRCNWTTECDNIVEKCTAAFHDKEHEFAIIYGDYFFIEAVWKLSGEEFFLW